MKWCIPAKTFLLGEYVALTGGPAIILTTFPCFQLELTSGPELQGIHPASPAAFFWRSCDLSPGLLWHDPYKGLGGLGASSAQFLGAYLAQCHLLRQEESLDTLLHTYHRYAWNGQGVRPSGYDVLAQSQHHCVYINQQESNLEWWPWPFNDLSFLLIHSGQKLATHEHLQSTKLPQASHLQSLAKLVEEAKRGFAERDSDKLIHAINAYQHSLTNLGLIATHSLEQLKHVRANPAVLAAKGCGALGADVLLLIVPKIELQEQIANLTEKNWTILASSNNLYDGTGLIKSLEKA